MPRVYRAEPKRMFAMGSLGDASGMLIRQFNFPDTYKEDEQLWNADHDRLLDQDYDHWKSTVEDYKAKIGNRGLFTWLEHGKQADVLEFLVKVLKADASVKWTGFRILGTVNRSNGYPVYSLEVFAKSPRSGTEVYSGESAPNVLTDTRHAAAMRTNTEWRM